MSTRQRILKAAASVLNKKGIDALSTRAVCKEAKVTAPTLYHHFRDKNDLLNDLVDLAYAEFLESKNSVKPSKSGLDELKRGWINYIEFAKSQPELFKVLCESWSRGIIPPAFQTTQDHLLELSERAVSGGETKIKDPRLVAHLSWSSAHGVAYLLATNPDYDWAKGLEKEASRILFDGLRK